MGGGGLSHRWQQNYVPLTKTAVKLWTSHLTCLIRIQYIHNFHVGLTSLQTRQQYLHTRQQFLPSCKS